jgi:hypothetical protein
MSQMHRIRFDEALMKQAGWDLAWDLDGHMKTLDRPDVPRLLPSIRFKANGFPACAMAEGDPNGRPEPKTLASIYLPKLDRVVKCIYDPNYRDEIYRWRLIEYDVHTSGYGSTRMVEKQFDTYPDMRRLFNDFVDFWVSRGSINPLDHYTIETAQFKPSAEIPQAYKDRGFGSFA